MKRKTQHYKEKQGIFFNPKGTQLGVAMFDTTHEPDTNPTRNNWVRVDCKCAAFDTINKWPRFEFSHKVMYP